jgi:biopolymer transport protein ExbD
VRKRFRTLEGDHFDLLPFINILMCVLSCLFLVTLGTVSLGQHEGWIVGPDNPKRPILVEWTGSAATVDSRGALTPLDNDQKLEDFMRELEAKRETHYVLIAVRPSGFSTFQQFARRFRQRKIDVGFEPIAENKSVLLLAGGTWQ